MRERVIKNAAECNLCHDVIESTHVHDFKYCRCGEIFVDGGLEYLRRGGKGLSNIIEKSEVVEEPISVWLSRDLTKALLRRFLIDGKNLSETIKSEIENSLRFSASWNIRNTIGDELRELTPEQLKKIGEIIEKELIGQNNAYKP